MTKKRTCNMEEPCNDLSSFKKLVLAIMAIQTTIVIVCLSLCVNSMSNQAQTNEKLTQVATRQQNLEKKADMAQANSTKALAISGKAESNIAWIREGLTELKLSLRNGSYRAPTYMPTQPKVNP